MDVIEAFSADISLKGRRFSLILLQKSLTSSDVGLLDSSRFHDSQMNAGELSEAAIIAVGELFSLN